MNSEHTSYSALLYKNNELLKCYVDGKSLMLDSYDEIVDSFGYQKYFGTVHMLQTAVEGNDALYYVELKPKYPSNKDVQVAVLWRYLETFDPTVIHPTDEQPELQELLRGSFQYIVDLWPPRPLEKRDIESVLKRIIECQSYVDQKPDAKSSYDRQVGYYINNKRKGNIFPSDIVRTIELASAGYVVHDSWNQIMIFLEIGNRYSLFYYFTGA